MTWHNTPEPCFEEPAVVVEMEHHKPEIHEKKEISRLGIAVAFISSCLFFYFVLSFVAHKIYEEARREAAKSADENDDLLKSIETYERIVRGNE